jgi:tetratricopeptide (TPR) repeat protein
MRWILSRVGFGLGLLFLSTIALSPRAEAQAAPAGADEEARALYEAGVIAYDGGRFEEALEHFQRSYELSGRTALLYNIATAAERARKDELALQTYEAFLAADPSTPLRPRVETRIAALREQLAAQQARVEEARAEEARRAEERARAATSTEAPAEAPPAEASRRGPGPAIVIGAGAAVAVAGAVMLGVGLADRSAVESPDAGSSWRGDVQRRYERGPALLDTGLVALPIGVIAAVAGVVWQVKRGSSDDGGGVEVGVGLGDVTIRGRF